MLEPALSCGTAVVGKISEGMLCVDGLTLCCVSHQREKYWLCELLCLCLIFCSKKCLYHYGAELSIRGVFPVMQSFKAHIKLPCSSPSADAVQVLWNVWRVLMPWFWLPQPTRSCLPHNPGEAGKGTGCRPGVPCAGQGLWFQSQEGAGKGLEMKLCWLGPLCRH